ncbi:hypothetical protein LYNGBM3L_25970 [Moorena producens 3L]|uniref:Uncharacterized protein n=1 Tax=Moorena producens 3L TaxID=489825 RepID=F4XNQ4_9CYAN|nr:hypothetical protein LYNGBM3L_25970 [Moorena producens 3L]
MGSAPERFTKLAIAKVSTAHQTINHNGSSTQVDVGWAVHQKDSPSWP